MNAPFQHRQVLLATLITTFVHVAVAEDAALPTISVTASPLVDSQTLNASIVEEEELKTLAPSTSDTASLLRNVPGLSLQGAGGVSSLPVIRGLADDRLRIKVDGMDLISACGNHMNPALSYIDPTNVSSATVFAGITPVSIGGDSIGGTILVDSAAPEFAKAGEGLLTTGEIGGSYRSNGDAQSGNIAATVAGEKLSLSYQGSTTKADNYTAGDDFKPAGPAAAGRGWLDGDEVGSTMYKSTNQSLGLALRHENHLVDLKYGEQDIPYQGFPNQRMDMTGNESEQINLNYDGQYDWGDLDARVYNEHTRHKMQLCSRYAHGHQGG
jgi:iron complex outermembrane receptor protein